MKEYDLIYAVGEIDPELIEEAKTETNGFPEREVRTRKSRVLTAVKRVAVIALAVSATAAGMLLLNENAKAKNPRATTSLTATNSRVYVNFADPDAGEEPGAEINFDDVTVGYVPEGMTLADPYSATDPGVKISLRGELVRAGDPIDPRVDIQIGRSGEYEPSFNEGIFNEYVYVSTINGMEAFVYDLIYPLGEKTFEICSVVFGNKDVTVCVNGRALSLDEITKIAESIKW